LVEMYCSVAY